MFVLLRAIFFLVVLEEREEEKTGARKRTKDGRRPIEQQNRISTAMPTMALRSDFLSLRVEKLSKKYKKITKIFLF